MVESYAFQHDGVLTMLSCSKVGRVEYPYLGLRRLDRASKPRG